jgi:lactonase
MKLKAIVILVLFSGAALCSIPSEALALPALVYDAHASYFHKLPEEKYMQTVVAQKWLQVSNKDIDTLEGLCFDRQGNLWMVGVLSGRIFKVTPKKQVTVVTTLKGKFPAGLKIHKDGRIFVAYLGDLKSTGGIVSFNPDGSDMRQIVAEGKYVCDDLFFDSKGGFYFTNFVGVVGNSIGSVEYVSPDFKTITTVVSNLTGPNGVVMTPNLKDTLFVSETCANRLDRFNLESDGITIKPYQGVVIYHFQGGWPDSLETDADGNLYQAMWSQGRFVVLDSKTGIPFAQILIPGRDKGHMLYSAHSAVIPGTNQIILAASDVELGQGMALYTAKVPAKAWGGYYQFQH